MSDLSAALAISLLCVMAHGQPLAGDSSERRTVELAVPTKLKVSRNAGQLSASFDPASLHTVKISVDKAMYLGLKDEVRVYRTGDSRPRIPSSVSFGSFGQQPVTWDQFLDRIPATDEAYTIEHDVQVFETSVAPQHMWRAAMGRELRVLWHKRLKSSSQM